MQNSSSSVPISVTHIVIDKGCKHTAFACALRAPGRIRTNLEPTGQLSGGGRFCQQATLCGGGILPLAPNVPSTLLVVANFRHDALLLIGIAVRRPTRFLGSVTL